jgi:membrane protein implicated in regulation of membrane protease activity
VDPLAFDPLKRLLLDAIKEVPAVKYALGVAGVAAAVAIVAGFQKNYKIAVFGTILMLGLMFVLVIFSKFVAAAGPEVRPLFLTLAWAFTVLTVITSALLLTSFFWTWPRPLTDYVPVTRDSSALQPPKAFAVDNLSDELTLEYDGGHWRGNRVFAVFFRAQDSAASRYEDRLYTAAPKASCTVLDGPATCLEVPRIDNWTTHEFLFSFLPAADPGSRRYRLEMSDWPSKWVAKWFRYNTANYRFSVTFPQDHKWKTMMVTLVKSGSAQPEILNQTANDKDAAAFEYSSPEPLSAETLVKFIWTV